MTCLDCIFYLQVLGWFLLLFGLGMVAAFAFHSWLEKRENLKWQAEMDALFKAQEAKLNERGIDEWA